MQGSVSLAIAAILARGVFAQQIAHPDKAHTVKLTIPLTGGSLSVTANDGTVYTLTVPDRALLSAQEISMTPLAAMDALPLGGGLVAGVQLEPEGLRFLAPVTLDIQMAAPLDPDQETPFSYHAGGDGFFLYPLEIDPTRTQFKLMHFSGYGVASGSAADRAAALARAPTRAEDALAQSLQPILAEERRIELQRLARNEVEYSPADQARIDELRSATVDLFRQYYENVVQPDLAAIGTACDPAAQAAIFHAISWARQATLLFSETQFQEQTHTALDAAVQLCVNCFNKAYRTCINDSDPAQTLLLIGNARMATILSSSETEVLGPGWQNKIDQCANMTFTLDFSSTLGMSDYTADLKNVEMQIHAGGIPFRWDAKAEKFQVASSPVIVYDRFAFTSVSNCSKGSIKSNPKLIQAEIEPNLNMTDTPQKTVTLKFSILALQTETLDIGTRYEGQCRSIGVSYLALVGVAADKSGMSTPAAVPFDGASHIVTGSGIWLGTTMTHRTSIKLTRSVP